ncbi:C40 family peptidase [Cyclobacterium amurskyense]|uniref:C40 family peptidase n=1 Tax=Cyclobacterium amurskyense TaxID=320787 RepID=UPI0030DBA25A|tara:strand:- start:2039 stop:2521 length:483 start_codon:yes stop_codon:yes gene_type:complete
MIKHQRNSLYVLFVFGLLLLLSNSCSSTKKIRQQNIQHVINTAKSYQGTPYRYGGNTRSGMDCSALVYLSFKSVGVTLPRVSAEQSKIGKRISKDKLKKGDVVFFATGRRRNKVTHAGIVSEKRMGKTYFIHASTSLGVTEDNLQSKYWSKRWVRGRRIF